MLKHEEIPPDVIEACRVLVRALKSVKPLELRAPRVGAGSVQEQFDAIQRGEVSTGSLRKTGYARALGPQAGGERGASRGGSGDEPGGGARARSPGASSARGSRASVASETSGARRSAADWEENEYEEQVRAAARAEREARVGARVARLEDELWNDVSEWGGLDDAIDNLLTKAAFHVVEHAGEPSGPGAFKVRSRSRSRLRARSRLALPRTSPHAPLGFGARAFL